MPLNDDQKLQIQQALITAGYSLLQNQLTQFVLKIETSIAAHLDAENNDAPEVEKNLSHLWQLAQDDDPPVGQIRAAIEKLSKGALGFIDRRTVGRRFPFGG